MSNAEDDEYEDFLLIIAFYHLLHDQLDEEHDEIHRAYDELLKEERKRQRSYPVEKDIRSWQQFADSVDDAHFRRMFRMPRPTFDLLCTSICDAVGVENFRPECSIENNSVKSKNAEALLYLGGLIPGEMKVALGIRMLAGGSYLDLVPLFNVSKSHLYSVFDEFLQWIMSTLQFPLVQWIRNRDWDQLKTLANEFTEKTGGVFHGPFGDLDGLAIRVRSPTLKEVSDPGNYYCRKGFFALNVQAICDKRKRFLWCYPSNKGSTHDSAAFANSRLNDLLQEVAEELHSLGIFIAADSAYGLTSYLIVPYDSDQIKKADEHQAKAMDAFNFYLSSCRIYIECAFGELIMRWGIFWRTLRFKLKKCQAIIQVAMLLQNFIVDNRDGTAQDQYEQQYFRKFNMPTRTVLQTHLTETTGEVPRALVTDNNEPHPGGRPTINEKQLRQTGEQVRHSLMVQLSTHNHERPLQHEMHYNSCGHIYMTS